MMIYTSIMTRIIRYVNVSVFILWMTSIDSGSAECSCYTFDGQPLKSWVEARRLCQTNNGELVSMETVGEWEFIKTEIQSKTTTEKDRDEWWIGLAKTDGVWKWLSNHSLTYNKWDNTSPKDDPQKRYVRIAKEYPADTYGSFSNIRDYLKRGTICEYKIPEECRSSLERANWCPPTTTPPTRKTMISTTTTPLNPSQTTKIPATDVGYSQAQTYSKLPSTSPIKDARQNFPTEIVASVIGVLLVLFLCLLIVMCIWKRKAKERKPRRNSHLGKKSCIPVKLEQSQSSINANDLIYSSDIINITGQTTTCSKYPVVNDNALQTEPAYTTINSQMSDTDVFVEVNKQSAQLYACVDKKACDHQQSNIKGSQMSEVTYAELNDHCHGNREEPGIMNYENELQVNNNFQESSTTEASSSTAVYATVDKSSKTASMDNRLVYAQLAEFKNEQEGSAKKPAPYNPTEYATIMTPILSNQTKSKENISQV